MIAMILLPLPVSSGLLLESRVSSRCRASIGEASGSQLDAPSRAIFSAIAASITPGSDELSSERISSRSETIVWIFPASHEYPSGTPLTTIVSVPNGEMSKPSLGALPKKVVTNDMLAGFLDTSDEWIYPRTGIKTRHVITDENLEDLGTEAVRKALEMSGLKAEDIDLFIVSNVVSEYITPGNELHHR